MKQRFLVGIACAWMAAAALAQTSPVYQNFGIVSDGPNIDATVFINSGVFEVPIPDGPSGSISIEPYETQNTLDFTNTLSGAMYSPSGFRFNFVTNGFQYPARSFYNAGNIQGAGANGLYGAGLIIDATNTVITGTVDAAGKDLVRITGENVNLTRGAFRSDGSGLMEIYNQLGTVTTYVAAGTNDLMLGDDLANKMTSIRGVRMPYPMSARHQVQYNDGSGRVTSVVVPSTGSSAYFAAYANTNLFNDSNLVVQVIFINTNLTDTNMTLQVGFIPTDTFASSIIQFGLADTDIIDGSHFTNYLTIVDEMAFVSSNFIWELQGKLERPRNFTMMQGRQTLYPPGSFTNNAVFTNTLIFPTASAPTTVTNTYGDWAGVVGVDTIANPAVDYPINPAYYDPTNFGGRVEINGDNLDLTRTRLRSASILNIKTKNLLGNVGCQLDAPIMRWDIGSTNGLLTISNLAPQSVARIAGSIQLYSEIWTNTVDYLVEDDAGGTITNTYTVYGNAVFVDQSLIGKRQMQVYDAAFHSTNIANYDDLQIVHALNLDAEGFYNAGTLNGTAIAATDWSIYTRLKYITNAGTIDTTTGNYVTLRTNPITRFVNSGTLNSAGQNIKAESIINSGEINANYGSTLLTAGQGKLDGGTITAVGNIALAMNDLKARQSSLSSAQLILQVTNSLTDGGPVDVSSQNNWNCYAGFNFEVLPKESDLRGTRLLCYGPKYYSVTNYSAAKNYGAVSAGFTNNLALGALILDGKEFSEFAFKGVNTNTFVTNGGVVTSVPANAIYVDYLDLRDYSTNLDLVFSDNIILYFAAASIPEEQLDGMFNGHLRWVRGYAGPASSTTVYLKNGQSISVNASLLNSSTADSNGDGVVNSQDPYPFDFQILSVAAAQNPTNGLTLTWNGAAQTIYYIDYATSVDASTWKQYQSVTNAATTNQVMSANVPKTSGDATRYYRVRYNP